MVVATADGSAAPGPAGIANFAWVEEGRLARGQQPRLTLAAYRELQEFGFSAVLSLRAACEYPGDERRSYLAADERALCSEVGLTFHHVACTDFQAPRPRDLVRALVAIQAEVEQGRAVYLHCLAGVGRTGVVSAAWQMLQGMSGTEALRQYAAFCEDARSRRSPHRALEEYLHAIGARYQAWVLLAVAAALGLEAKLPNGFVVPEQPARTKTWRRRFRDELRRQMRSGG